MKTAQQIPERLRHIHFIGCAGAGTQPLALIFLELGFDCSGSDLLATPATELLQRKGFRFFQGHRAENLGMEFTAGNSLVVFTSAAAEDNPELIEAQKRGIACLRRGAALARIGQEFPRTLAIAGSHGKTSVTSLCAYTLKELGYDPGFLIGGNVTGWSISGTAGGKKYFVTEVDESDSTNALFHASTAVITNVEDDHAWSVGGPEALYQSFVQFASQSEHTVYVQSERTELLFKDLPHKTILNGLAYPDWPWPANWGPFQQQNAVTAFSALKQFIPDLDEQAATASLMRFPGVERRMSLRFDGFFRVIEDYAHHPTEVAASLTALRKTNPGRRLLVLFQPHRYARLERYLDDFVRVLGTADRLFIAPVFAAWTASAAVNSETLARLIGPKAKAVEGSWEEIAKQVLSEVREGDLIAVIGAGDIRKAVDFLRV